MSRYFHDLVITITVNSDDETPSKESVLQALKNKVKELETDLSLLESIIEDADTYKND